MFAAILGQVPTLGEWTCLFYGIKPKRLPGMCESFQLALTLSTPCSGGEMQAKSHIPLQLWVQENWESSWQPSSSSSTGPCHCSPSGMGELHSGADEGGPWPRLTLKPFPPECQSTWLEYLAPALWSLMQARLHPPYQAPGSIDSSKVIAMISSCS